MNKTIVLLTDFGLEDDYVGLMHAVIKGISPTSSLIDLTHSIPFASIESAAFVLEKDYSFFPEKSVVLVVVDPGVGSEREILVVEYAGRVFIGPDNGVLAPILEKCEEENLPVRRLVLDDEWKMNSSNTFHGRDIFSPLVAKIAEGELAKIKLENTEKYLLNVDYKMKCKGNVIEGKILWIDRFGNLISNVSGTPNEIKSVKVDGHSLTYVRTFSDASGKDPVWTIGSKGTVEIIINGENAAEVLGFGLGKILIVELLD